MTEWGRGGSGTVRRGLVAALGAWIAATAAAAPPLPAGPGHVMEEHLAPTPFTAEQIRTGCPVGRTVTFRVREPGGGSELLSRMRFVESDAEGALVRSETLSLDGTPLVESRSGRSAWAELQSHAAFPAASTTIVSLDDVGSELGSRAGWLYRVRGEDGGETLLWFASDLPGPPVRLKRRDPLGLLLGEMVMVAGAR